LRYKDADHTAFGWVRLKAAKEPLSGGKKKEKTRIINNNINNNFWGLRKGKKEAANVENGFACLTQPFNGACKKQRLFFFGCNMRQMLERHIRVKS
jgi:hypothetical protein